jgi:hypothetical protein
MVWVLIVCFIAGSAGHGVSSVRVGQFETKNQCWAAVAQMRRTIPAVDGLAFNKAACIASPSSLNH